MFQKKSRQSRWIGDSVIAAEASTPVANDEATIQAGEVWLVMWGSKKVVPTVVYGAFASLKNGLRPETNPEAPLLLKNVESVQLQLFGKETIANDQGSTFKATDFDLTRKPRQLLCRLACSRGPFVDVDVSLIRSQRLLTLCPPARQRLEALQADPKIEALWKQLSSGGAAAEGEHPLLRRCICS